MPAAFPPEFVQDLEDVLSSSRFTTYVRACRGDRQRAVALYGWNTEVAAALYTPLQFAEIAVRNGAIAAIVPEFGPDWHRNAGFHTALRERVGRLRPREEVQRLARRHHTAGAVAAELPFAFWQQLFVSAQDVRLWDQHLRAAFPGTPAQLSVAQARQRVHDDVEAIRGLRNRIAHHEPLIARNIADDLARALSLIEWRRPTVAAWIGSIEGVTALMQRRP